MIFLTCCLKSQTMYVWGHFMLPIAQGGGSSVSPAGIVLTFFLWKASVSSRWLGCPPRYCSLWGSSLFAFRKWKMCSTTGRCIELSPKIRRSCSLSSMTTSRRRRSPPRVQIHQCILHQAAQAKRYRLSQCHIWVLCSLWCCGNAEAEKTLIFKPESGAWPVSYYTLMLQ